MTQTSNRDFDQRVVLVTGGTKGIGRGITEGFLAEGATVVVCARSVPEALPAVERRSARCLPCDVRDAEAVQASRCHVQLTAPGALLS